ncbi:MAG: hypothetical protein HY788_20955 [Deltaproteobacteria bacterium]|nr:hypothetical protein [Deltaproteobacteria bacterium]
MNNKVLLTVCFFFLLSGMAWAVPDGVYKDVAPSGNPEDVKYALYVQTYESQAIIAVLLDNSGGAHNAGQRLYAFLGSEYTAGLDEDEIGGADAHLTLSPFSGDTTAEAVFTAGGVIAAFSIYRWTEAPDTVFTDLNGIYKDQPPMGATPLFNLYFQTYHNVTPTSAIAIVTDDSGASFFAFLDSDVEDGFSEFDLLKAEAHLGLTFAPVSTDVQAIVMPSSIGISAKEGSFAFTPPGEIPVTGDIYKYFQAPAIEVVF